MTVTSSSWGRGCPRGHLLTRLLDPVMGPMSIRVATYFPFNVTCYLNGHSFAAQELTRDGVRFRKSDNAFLAVADVAALQGCGRSRECGTLGATLLVLGASASARLQPDRTRSVGSRLPLQHGPDR